MDFAEAYLVAQAEATGVGAIVSFDRSIGVQVVQRIRALPRRQVRSVTGITPLASVVLVQRNPFGRFCPRLTFLTIERAVVQETRRARMLDARSPELGAKETLAQDRQEFLVRGGP